MRLHDSRTGTLTFVRFADSTLFKISSPDKLTFIQDRAYLQSFRSQLRLNYEGKCKRVA